MVTERIKKLIANMVLNYNFWGFLFSRIRIVERENLPFPMHVECDRYGTISLVLIGNIFDIMTEREILKLLEHEGYHLLNQHLVRLLRIIRDETDPLKTAVKIKAWNYAADFVVNQLANLFDVTVNGCKYRLLRPEDYNLPSNKVAEWYYQQLIKESSNNDKPQQNQVRQNNQCSRTNERNEVVKWYYQQLMESSNNGELQQNHNQIQQSNDQDSQTNEQNKGAELKTVGDKTNHSNWFKGVHPEDTTLIEKVRRNIQDIVRESYRSFKKTRGTLPGSIEELIQKLFLPPKLPYYQIIRNLVQGSRLSKYKRSSEVVNRKLVYTYYLPNTLPTICPFPGYKLDFSFVICIVIDVSGSMKPEDIREALVGVKNIIENDRSCKTIVLENDTTVQKEYVCRKISDIQFKVRGRGGTTLGPALFRAKELKCDICLVFTDGYCENMTIYKRKDLPRKVVWILTENGNDESIRSIGPVVRLPK